MSIPGESLSGGSLSQGGLCPGGGLCLEGSLCLEAVSVLGVSVHRGSPYPRPPRQNDSQVKKHYLPLRLVITRYCL